MSSQVLSRAKAHFEQQGLHKIAVPEWGAKGSPLVIYWTPLTVSERRKIYEPVDGKTPDGGTIMVRALLRKACNADGKKLFTEVDDEHELLHKVDGEVVGRISNAILFGIAGKSVDDMVDDAGKD